MLSTTEKGRILLKRLTLLPDVDINNRIFLTRILNWLSIELKRLTKYEELIT